MRFLSALMLCAAGIAVAFAVDADDVIRDTRFNHGDFRVDAFGAAFTEYPRGQRILALPDGDLVVAAVVPLPGGSTYTLGLTRYGADGTPRPWAVPSHPLTLGDAYVIHDAGAKPLDVKYVRDLELWDGVLYVLVSVDTSPRFPPGAPDPFEAVDEVHVLAFEVSGKFLHGNRIRAASADPLSPRTFAAGGIAFYLPDPTAAAGQPHMVYGGAAYDGHAHAEFARYSVAVPGVLAEIVPPRAIDAGGICTDDSDCEFRAVALGGRPSPKQPPRIYLGGWRKPHGGTADFLAIRVDADGTPARDFGSSGGVTVDFPYSDLAEDFGRLLAVIPVENRENQDIIYQSGEIRARCARGAGIVKLTAKGVVDRSFGHDGRVRWYAPDAPSPDGPECLSHGNLIRLRGGMTIDNDRIVLAALRERGVSTPRAGLEADAMLTTVDLRSGELKANDLVQHEAGSRTHDSGFTDLVVREKGVYVTTGFIRVPFWSIPAWASQAATAGLKVN